MIVCRLLVDRTANLNFLGDRSYAIDALDRAFGRDLLGIAGDVSGERHDAVIYGNTNVCSVDARLEIEFIDNRLSESLV